MAVSTQKGIFSWNELMTKDAEGARNFYTRLFGWEAEEGPNPGDGGSYTVFKAGGEQVAGMMALPPQAEQMGARPYWGAYVNVDDVDGTVKMAREMGATILVQPTDITGMGRFATFLDPQGAVISIIKYGS